MTEIETTEGAVKVHGRRTILKGAAWSVPVIAAAVATPLASASTGVAAIRIYGDCLLNAVGAKIGQGFFVNNQGTAAFAGTVLVSEQIQLTGAAAAPIVRNAIWAVLAVEGILGGNTSGVSRGAWTIVSSGNGITTPFVSTATRAVTLSAPLAVGETRSWGVAADAVAAVLDILDLIGLAGISQTATITSPTGSVVIDSTDTLNWELLSTSC